MELIDSTRFSADRAWASQLLMDMGEHTARIHWTDKPYRWHENTGDELFVVLDGLVEMAYEEGGREATVLLRPGQVAVFRQGDRHVARPHGEARILVIERKDSE